MRTRDITDLTVCEACEQFHAGSGIAADEFIAAKTGAASKVIYCALERASSRNLIDYGVSLRTAWVTDKGRALLEANGVQKV